MNIPRWSLPSLCVRALTAACWRARYVTYDVVLIMCTQTARQRNYRCHYNVTYKRYFRALIYARAKVNSSGRAETRANAPALVTAFSAVEKNGEKTRDIPETARPREGERSIAFPVSLFRGDTIANGKRDPRVCRGTREEEFQFSSPEQGERARVKGDAREFPLAIGFDDGGGLMHTSPLLNAYTEAEGAREMRPPPPPGG